MTDFSAEERALDCCADLDGHLELVTDDDGNDCVPSGAVDIIRGYIDRAFEAGRASRDAEVAELRAGLEKAQANYQFMVERACDEKLDGYRELGTRLATSEQARDSLRAQLAEKDAEIARLRREEKRQVLKGFLRNPNWLTTECRASDADAAATAHFARPRRARAHATDRGRSGT